MFLPTSSNGFQLLVAYDRHWRHLSTRGSDQGIRGKSGLASVGDKAGGNDRSN